jgi:hypothetical protein
MTLVEFERLAVYGFGIDYPADCVVEFNPKSDRNAGDVAFKSPNGYKIYVSWGELKKVEKFQDVEAHADYSVDRIRGSREANVIDAQRESTKVNGHDAALSRVKLDLIKRGLFFNKTRTAQDVLSLHIHCANSSRYFVIYGPGRPDQAASQSEAVSRMIETFTCH